MFGSDVDIANLPRTSPHNDFEKWDANANLSWQPIDGLTIRSVIAGQAARMGLPGQEQLFLGGAGSVRGFKEGSLSGDRGAYMRNEFSFSHELIREAARSNVYVDPFLLFDASVSRLLSDPVDRHLASAGVGLRMNWKGLNADLAWAKPLTAPEWVSREARLHLLLSAQF